ncbi:MAG: DUF2147 domain-containing protein, partial [Alphaproteobacteria bacterium]|nr:DUF2147 domain-containing protein [Alphaproteobacteria bacterium]
MRRLIMAATAAIIVMAPATARADAFSGLWLTENGKAVVELKPCANSICGNIHWLRADAKQYDYQNPEEAAR